jgi:hypothetical protein
MFGWRGEVDRCWLGGGCGGVGVQRRWLSGGALRGALRGATSPQCFDREQHESLFRQLFHISQSGSLSDYVEQFASLVDELAAYVSRTDPFYYSMCFVDGLKHVIRTVVMVQRPPNLDTSCALALV